MGDSLTATTPMANDDDIEGALTELLEAQKELERIGRMVVDGVKRIVSAGVNEKLVPGQNDVFARLHGKWYEDVWRDLKGAGFRDLGPFKQAVSEAPPEKDAYYRFALSDDGLIVASWFMLAAVDRVPCVILQSYRPDGTSCTTASGVILSGVPNHPDATAKLLPAGAPVGGMVKLHRREMERAGTTFTRFTNIDEIVAARLRDNTINKDFREEQGLALFEPYLRAFYKEEYEEQGAPILDVILEHPEWWTGEEPSEGQTAAEGHDPNAPVRLLFLMSRDPKTSRGHITTTGMLLHGLPELQMKDLAANHSRVARYLMMTVARKLVQLAGDSPDKPALDLASGVEITITPDDLPSKQSSPVLGRFPEVNEAGPITLRLDLEEFGGDGGKLGDIFSVLLQKKRAAELLHVKPPNGTTVDKDEWLRVTGRRLGLDTPAAQPFSALDDAMKAASQRAVQTLPALREQLQAGQHEGQIVAIKTVLPTESGTREYVWVTVDEWPPGEFGGTLSVQPTADCPGFTKGQRMRVADADVFDRAIFSPTEGPIEPALTDIVAQDFGVDLPD